MRMCAVTMLTLVYICYIHLLSVDNAISQIHSIVTEHTQHISISNNQLGSVSFQISEILNKLHLIPHFAKHFYKLLAESISSLF